MMGKTEKIIIRGVKMLEKKDEKDKNSCSSVQTFLDHIRTEKYK